MMKSKTIGCVSLLLVAALWVSPVQAQICLDFVFFVDGLELTIQGDLITGWWRNWDGNGSDAPVIGIIQDGLPGPCHPGNTVDRDDPQWPGKAGIVCEPDFGCDAGGDDWYFILDGTDNSLDVGLGVSGFPRPGACGIDDVHYDVLLGPCPFFGLQEGQTSTALAASSLR